MTPESPDRASHEPPTPSEADLVARAQSGEEAAFAAIFEAHKRRVYSLCLRITRDTAEAEDLTQEAFLKVFRRISTFRGESTFSTWLHRLVVNTALMHLRKKRLEQVPLDEVHHWLEEPLRREYGEDDRISLDRALNELSPGYRAVFILYDVCGYEHGEIARMMKTSIGNSKSQLHKARRKLREWLGGAEEKMPPLRDRLGRRPRKLDIRRALLEEA